MRSVIARCTGMSSLFAHARVVVAYVFFFWRSHGPFHCCCSRRDLLLGLAKDGEQWKRAATMGSKSSKEQNNPSYFKVVEPLLREQDGDPGALMRQFPSFDPEAVACEGTGSAYLAVACRENHVHALRGLLSLGASLKRRGGIGSSTPLVMACSGSEASRAELVASLLSHADAARLVNHAGAYGRTPLHYPAAFGNEAVARVLLQGGADPTRTYEDGEEGRTTAAKWARRQNHRRTAELLERAERMYGADTLDAGPWRPHNYRRIPTPYRAALRALTVLAKASLED